MTSNIGRWKQREGLWALVAYTFLLEPALQSRLAPLLPWYALSADIGQDRLNQSSCAAFRRASRIAWSMTGKADFAQRRGHLPADLESLIQQVDRRAFMTRIRNELRAIQSGGWEYGEGLRAPMPVWSFLRSQEVRKFLGHDFLWQILKTSCRGDPCPIVIEAGAREGEDSVAMCRSWPHAVVHALEPIPSSFARMKSLGCPVGPLFPFWGI